jgi:hypothetical protein
VNWQEFFEAYDIEYVAGGKNTKKGELSVNCPYCGQDDPSFHLGVSLTSENWGCLRHGGHRGKAPYKLIQALLGCSYTQAKLIVAQYSRSDPTNLDEALATLMGETTESPKASTEPLKLPGRPIHRASSNTRKFFDYLTDRGFNNPKDVSAYYGLRACLTGRFKDRIIFPFYDADWQLIAYTGRALGDPIKAPRYLSSDRIKDTVFNEPGLADGGPILLVVEGPFDALKLDYYGSPIKTTCTFGITPHVNQLAILAKLKKRFKRTIVLFDVGAVEQAWHLADALGLEVGSLPEGVDDPGMMSQSQVIKFVKSLLTIGS